MLVSPKLLACLKHSTMNAQETCPILKTLVVHKVSMKSMKRTYQSSYPLQGCCDGTGPEVPSSRSIPIRENSPLSFSSLYAVQHLTYTNSMECLSWEKCPGWDRLGGWPCDIRPPGHNGGPLPPGSRMLQISGIATLPAWASE